MDHEHEVTRAQMGETRAALSEKLETLEQHMVDTVHDAAHAVAQTVENVKEAVHDTVESVKDNFDLRLQVDRHPWAMIGGSLALGYLAGYHLLRRSAALPAPAGKPTLGEHPNGNGKDARTVDAASAQHRANCATEPGHLSGVNDQFATEIANLKKLAIGTLLSLVRDLVTQAAPKPMQAGLANVIDGVTIQLGGDPIQGPVLKTEQTAT